MKVSLGLLQFDIDADAILELLYPSSLQIPIGPERTFFFGLCQKLEREIAKGSSSTDPVRFEYAELLKLAYELLQSKEEVRGLGVRLFLDTMTCAIYGAVFVASCGAQTLEVNLKVVPVEVQDFIKRFKPHVKDPMDTSAGERRENLLAMLDGVDVDGILHTINVINRIPGCQGASSGTSFSLEGLRACFVMLKIGGLHF